MSFKTLTALVATTLALSGAAFADTAHKIMVHDAYARASNAKAGAAFMEIMNHTDTDDRLIAVKSGVAARTQLHTHQEDANGVMKMLHVEDGFVVPAGESVVLERGGNHVMFMGLTHPFEDGETIPVTLVFEKAGDVSVDVPVNLGRKPSHDGHSGHDHTEHDHNAHDHSEHDHSHSD